MNELGCEMTRVVSWFFRESDREQAKRRLDPKRQAQDLSRAAIQYLEEAEMRGPGIITDPML